MNSKKYSLNKQDGKKILSGALIAGTGAILTYLTAIVTEVDFGTLTPAVVALYGVVANTIRKFISEQNA